MPLIRTLRHLHISGITPFNHVESLQEKVVALFQAYKKATLDPPPVVTTTRPIPTLLTFTPTPVYTLGRREINTLSAAEIEALKAPFYPQSYGMFRAQVVQTKRGGQMTFHGPGQLVIYPIIDLRPLNLTPRDYVKLLEETTIRTLSKFNIEGKRTEDPGIWTVQAKSTSHEGGIVNGKGDEVEKKIAALGLHMRRNITSYGVGLNINTNLKWYDRIVACGLAGKGVTSMEAELVDNPEDSRTPETIASKMDSSRYTVRVARIWAEQFANNLWGEEGKVHLTKLPGLEPGQEDAVLRLASRTPKPWRR